MSIVDIEGKKITVTDLDKAITDAEQFTKYRHTDKTYAKLDERNFKYWNDIHNKLIDLKNKAQ